MRKPRRRVRRTEPLPKMYALQYTPQQRQHRTAKNARARTTSTSVSVPYACRKSGPEAGRKQDFSEVTVAWANAYEQVYANDAIHWFLHRFNVDLVDTLRAFKAAAAARLMCSATASLPLPGSIQHLHPFTGRNSCGRSAPTCRSASPFWQRQGIPATLDSLKPSSSHAVHQCFVHKKNLSEV